MVREEVTNRPPATLKGVVRAIGWPSSSFFWHPTQEKRKPGPARREVDQELAKVVLATALKFPFWGYKRIAVVVRRAGVAVSNRFVYAVLKAANLLQKKTVQDAELYQAAKLFQLLPQRPNDLWQADVERHEALWNLAVVKGHRLRHVAA